MSVKLDVLNLCQTPSFKRIFPLFPSFSSPCEKNIEIAHVWFVQPFYDSDLPFEKLQARGATLELDPIFPSNSFKRVFLPGRVLSQYVERCPSLFYPDLNPTHPAQFVVFIERYVVLKFVNGQTVVKSLFLFEDFRWLKSITIKLYTQKNSSSKNFEKNLQKLKSIFNKNAELRPALFKPQIYFSHNSHNSLDPKNKRLPLPTALVPIYAQLIYPDVIITFKLFDQFPVTLSLLSDLSHNGFEVVLSL